MDVNSIEYKVALVDYLRRGLPMDWSLKRNRQFRLENIPERYIWRTQGDGNVRGSHAVNDGRTFTRDNPPPTGHPGEEYGCRCVAEAVSGTIFPEGAFDNYLTDIFIAYLDGQRVWQNFEMSLHYYFGGGAPVTLSRIGYLNKVRSYYKHIYLERFIGQIRQKIYKTQSLIVTDRFEATYDFRNVFFSLGQSTITGRFSGRLERNNGENAMAIGEAKFLYQDSFKDPIDIAQSAVTLINSFRDTDNKIREKELYSWLVRLANLGGDIFQINGEWAESLEFKIDMNLNETIQL